MVGEGRMEASVILEKRPTLRQPLSDASRRQWNGHAAIHVVVVVAVLASLRSLACMELTIDGWERSYLVAHRAYHGFT